MKTFCAIFCTLAFSASWALGAFSITVAFDQYQLPSVTYYDYEVKEGGLTYPDEIISEFVSNGVQFRDICYGRSYILDPDNQYSPIPTGISSFKPGATIYKREVWYRWNFYEGMWVKNNTAHIDISAWGKVPPVPPVPDPPDPILDISLVPDQVKNENGIYQYRIDFKNADWSFTNFKGEELRTVTRKIQVVNSAGEVVFETERGVNTFYSNLPLFAGMRVRILGYDSLALEFVIVNEWGLLPEPDKDPENPDPIEPLPEDPDPEDPENPDPDPENPDPENPDPEKPDPENPGKGEFEGYDYRDQLDQIRSELAKQSEAESGRYEEEKSWRDKLLDLLLEKLTDQEGGLTASAEGKLSDEQNRAVTGAQGFESAWGNRTFGKELSSTGENTVNTSGSSPRDPWLFTVPIAGVSVDMNPINALLEIPGAVSIFAWLRRSIILMLTFWAVRYVWGTVEKIQAVLQTQTEAQGQNELMIAPIGFGVTTRSISGLIKAGLYAVAFLAFSALAWGVAAGFGITPSLGATLFATDGAPAFGWAFFDLFLPLDFLGSVAVTAALARGSIWLTGMCVSVVRQGASTI